MNQDFFRTMGTGEIIAQALRLYKGNFEALVTIILLPQGLLLAGSMALENFVSPGTGLLGVLVATTVLNAVAFAAITTAVTGVALGATPTLMGTYALTLRNRPFAVVAAYSFTAMITSVGFMMFVMPGLVAGGFFALVVPAMVVEGHAPLVAIRRSVSLIRTEPLKGIAIFTFVIGVGGLFPLLFQLAVGLGPLTPLLSALVGALTLPLAYTANVLLYFSFRAAEGYSRAGLEQDMAGALNR